jgi:uncharacterized RDD family membrane protein YckC
MDITSSHEETLQLANRGKRLINYIVDSLTVSVLSLPVAELLNNFRIDIGNRENLYFIIAITSFLYYTIFEATSGVTLGKRITGTKVVDEYGEKPPLKTALLRSLCRFIPFYFIPFLLSEIGWHDSLSKTRVVIRNRNTNATTIQ